MARPRQRYAAREIVPAIECMQQPSIETAECTRCEKLFKGGSIVSGPAEYDPKFGTWFRLRKLYCDHCGHIQFWLQACRPDGTLLGELVSGPGHHKSPSTIERFLKQHPEAAGVAQDEGHP